MFQKTWVFILHKLVLPLLARLFSYLSVSVGGLLRGVKGVIERIGLIPRWAYTRVGLFTTPKILKL